jgi:hypothetical protein
MELELVRQQWQAGSRRLESARDPALLRQVDLVLDELRKRVGQTFTLGELAGVYERADDWARDLIDDADPASPPPVHASIVADAAFHQFARGATDYRP